MAFSALTGVLEPDFGGGPVYWFLFRDIQGGAAAPSAGTLAKLSSGQ